MAEAAVDGDALLLGFSPLVPAAQIVGLTAAEVAVLAYLIAGSTNGDIAHRRDCSEHTVANQVQAIFRKLGVRSRSELALRLQSRA